MERKSAKAATGLENLKSLPPLPHEILNRKNETNFAGGL